MKYLSAFLVLCLLVSCAPAPVQPTQTSQPTAAITWTPKPSVTPFPPPTRAATWTPEASATPAAPLFTPDPLRAYTINYLRSRSYGGGVIENLGLMDSNKNFERFSIRYLSDGLNIYGFMDVPKGEGPFPVIFALHGYVNPQDYKTLDYSTDAADVLAAQGYIVIHPNYRNFPPSDNGDVLYRVGYAVDILNLIEIVRQVAGKPGPLEKANAARMGIWAHSLGGEIALKVAEVSPAILAIVLYSGVGGNEKAISSFFAALTGNKDNTTELQASPEQFAAISPDHFYGNIRAAIQIHHGRADSVIPVAWAEETCKSLANAGVKVDCFYYLGADHTFRARFIDLFGQRVQDFFAQYLK